MEVSDTLLGRPDDATVVEVAFVALYRATFRQVYAFARAHVADAATAEELTSRIYLKAYQRRHRAPAQDRQRFWLFRIARTTLIDYYRTESPRRAVTIELDELGDVRDTTGTPEQQLLARERAAALLRAVGELGTRDRELLTLKFAGRQTNQEIAEVLGVSPAAVSMRLMRALRHLRRRLGASESRP